jgi:hypothetical protein
VEIKRQEEIFRATHKRQIIEKKHEPRWASNSNYGYNLSTYNADPARLYKRSLLPLGVKPL